MLVVQRIDWTSSNGSKIMKKILFLFISMFMFSCYEHDFDDFINVNCQSSENSTSNFSEEIIGSWDCSPSLFINPELGEGELIKTYNENGTYSFKEKTKVKEDEYYNISQGLYRINDYKLYLAPNGYGASTDSYEDAMNSMSYSSNNEFNTMTYIYVNDEIYYDGMNGYPYVYILNSPGNFIYGEWESLTTSSSYEVFGKVQFSSENMYYSCSVYYYPDFEEHVEPLTCEYGDGNIFTIDNETLTLFKIDYTTKYRFRLVNQCRGLILDPILSSSGCVRLD